MLIERDRRLPTEQSVLEGERRVRTSLWRERWRVLRIEGGEDESSLSRERQGRVVERRVATEELRVAEICWERVLGKSVEVGVMRKKGIRVKVGREGGLGEEEGKGGERLAGREDP